MGTIVDAIVPSAQFALGETFEAVPDAEVETVRTVATEEGCVMPYVWARAPDIDRLERVLEADPTTRSVARLGHDGERSIYRVDWGPGVTATLGVLVGDRGTLLSARGRHDRWEFRMLFPEHDAVSATYDCCHRQGIDLGIRRVMGVTQPIGPASATLSEEQQEALVTAFETNYYDVPRELTQEELADELGVSHQALSERLRRGHRLLVERTLSNPTASDDSHP